MATESFGWRAGALVSGAAAVIAMGCWSSHGLDGPPGLDGPATPGVPFGPGEPPPVTDAGPPPTTPPGPPRPTPTEPPPFTGDVDILLVVDDSPSMDEEQASLRDGFAAFVVGLTTGDLDGDGVAEHPPVRSIHAGVVTTDMGTRGHPVPTCRWPDHGHDGTLRQRQAVHTEGCPVTRETFGTWEAGDESLDPLLDHVRCTATVGTQGCGFEQPLEAALKALSPSAPTAWTREGYAAPSFHAETAGHGDGINDRFVREGSTLVIVLLTDEDDCSAEDPALYDPAAPAYGPDLNTRCVQFTEALHHARRYVSGIRQLREHPQRIVFAPIVGIPADLLPGPGELNPWPRLVGDPGERDPRMHVRPDPSSPARVAPSCQSPERGSAMPPERVLMTARGLEASAVRVALGSICEGDYGPAFRAIARAIWR